jgi:hypothetical protein
MPPTTHRAVETPPQPLTLLSPPLLSCDIYQSLTLPHSLRALHSTDHLAFSVIWEMDDDANILDVRFCKSAIHSVASLTYDDVRTHKLPLTPNVLDSAALKRTACSRSTPCSCNYPHPYMTARTSLLISPLSCPVMNCLSIASLLPSSRRLNHVNLF